MRVLMVSKACIVGIYQRKLEHIAQQGIDLRVLVPPLWRDERGEQHLERVYTSGYQLQTTPIRFNGNFHLHYYPHAADHIRQFKPHIVHIDEEPYNAATWHLLYHAQRHHARTLFFSWQNIHRQYPPPFRWGEQWALRQVDYALMGTDSAGEVWRAKGYAGPMATVPQFGIDPDLFQPQARPADRPFTIGYIGRLVPEKGVQHLLNAVTGLSDARWQLRIVGSGPLTEALQQQCQRHAIDQQVTFIQWVPSVEMPAQYQAIDVLVLPSLTRPNWKEQFGRVLVEAMASGIPVIGSDSGAIPDVIGDGGLIFPEGDVQALRDALHRLQTDADLRQQLGCQGRQRVLAHFTHEQVAQATVAAYQAIGKPSD